MRSARLAVVWQKHSVAMIIIIATGFWLTTSGPDHAWGDDFAQYILHARNIAQGLPYAETGYVQNTIDPIAFHVGPRAYPPLTALLFAPVYALRGVDYAAFKGVQALELAFALWCVALLLRRYTHAWVTVACVALLAIHPWMLDAKELIGSDVLFFGLCYAALASVERVVDDHPGSVAHWAAYGLLLYLACAARTVGVALLPVGLVLIFARTRRITWVSTLSIAIPVALLLLQRAWIPRDTSYLKILGSGALSDALYNTTSYSYELAGALAPMTTGRIRLLAVALALPFIARSLWGGIRRVRALDVFLAGYLGTLIVWPANGEVRFLLPVLPAVLFYVLDGAHSISLRVRPWIRHAVVAALVVGEIASLASHWRTRPLQATHPDFLAFAALAKRVSNPDDRFIFHKPRLFALLTGRGTAVFNKSADDTAGWQLIETVGARYVAFGEPDDEGFVEDASILKAFVQRNAAHFHLEWRQGPFVLYRVASFPRGASPPPR
jgi:hypothetical protein